MEQKSVIPSMEIKNPVKKMSQPGLKIILFLNFRDIFISLEK